LLLFLLALADRMPFINERCLLAREDFGEVSPSKMYPCVIVLNITVLGDHYGGK
jgi:hypothetical protein